MITEPLFQDNILSNIYHNFQFYFGYNHFSTAVLAVIGLNLLAVLAVRMFFNLKTYQLLPAEKYYIALGNKKDIFSAALFFLSLSLYVINVFSLNGTIFNAYDTMNIDSIQNMQRGIKPIFDSVRFSPLQSIDFNIIYAVTHNFRVVDCWTIIKQILCLCLMYKFFDFVPVYKRLVMLAVINLLPAVFWINNAIFSEQNTLIFILLSFFSLRCGGNSYKTINLIGFILFMNLAIYTKETNIFIYAGMLISFVLHRVFTGEIVLKSFLHPFRTLSQMPLEYILFCAMLIYSIMYLLQSNLLTDGAYLKHNHRSLLELLKIYSFDIKSINREKLYQTKKA